MFRSTTESAGEAYALDGLGGVDLLRGEHRRALDRLREALALFRRIGERAGEARVSNTLGEAAAATGRLAEARAHHLSALRLAEEIGNRYEQPRARDALERLPGAGTGAHPDDAGAGRREFCAGRHDVPA